MKQLHYDSNKVTVLSKHTQFKTYIDEYRKEYFNEGDILNSEIYERGEFTDVGTLIHEAVKDRLSWQKTKRAFHKQETHVSRM